MKRAVTETCNQRAQTPRSGDRADFDEYSHPLGGMGTATTLPVEEQEEAVRLLHEAVFAVTGKRVEPAKHPIGFA